MRKEFKIVLVSVILDAAVVLEDIGICYIAAYLRKFGYNVKIISDMISKIKINEIINLNPDIVCFSTYNQTVETILKLSYELKNELPNVKIMYGGNTATFYGEELMRECPIIDFIIQGEGEISTKALMDCLSKNTDFSYIDGLIYRKGGKVFCNSPGKCIDNLDILPMPARDVLETHNLKIAILSESRGCTHNCYFCSSHSFWSNQKGGFCWRSRSTSLIIDEIKDLYYTYNIRHFWFSDPSFEDPGFNEKRMTDICYGIIESKLNISFIIYVRGDFYKKVSNKLMKLLLNAGLSSVFIGAETINESDRKIYGKIATNQDVVNSLAFFGSHEVSVDIGFINFNPYSTFDGLKENCDFLWKYGYFVCGHYLSKVMIFKGSRLYNQLIKDKLLYDGSYSNLFGYHFVDKRIEKLCDFLYMYMKKIQQGTSTFEEITLLTHLQKSRIFCLKRRLNKHDKNDFNINSLLDEYLKDLDLLCHKINTQLYYWYKGLLLLAESNKSIYELELYSNKQLNINMLQKYVNEMKKKKILLVKNLSKSEYVNYL